MPALKTAAQRDKLAASRTAARSLRARAAPTETQAWLELRVRQQAPREPPATVPELHLAPFGHARTCCRPLAPSFTDPILDPAAMRTGPPSATKRDAC